MASGPSPSYTSDFSKMAVYVTPASIIEDQPVVGDRLMDPTPRERVKITKNAVNTVTQTTESGRFVLPALITYMAYPPLTTFRAYSLGGIPPPVIRIGKKEPPARVRYEKLGNVEVKRGVFEPTHPVSPIDLPRDTKIIKTEIHYMRPSPLFIRSTLDGLYVTGLDERGRRHVIALPSPRRYPAVTELAARSGS